MYDPEAQDVRGQVLFRVKARSRLSSFGEPGSFFSKDDSWKRNASCPVTSSTVRCLDTSRRDRDDSSM